MQNYYVAALAVSQGKNRPAFLTSGPLKSLNAAIQDVLPRVGKAKPVDLRVRLVSPKEAKLLRRISASRQNIERAATELQSLHNPEQAAVAPVKRASARRKVSRLARRVKKSNKKS